MRRNELSSPLSTARSLAATPLSADAVRVCHAFLIHSSRGVHHLFQVGVVRQAGRHVAGYTRDFAARRDIGSLIKTRCGAKNYDCMRGTLLETSAAAAFPCVRAAPPSFRRSSSYASYLGLFLQHGATEQYSPRSARWRASPRFVQRAAQAIDQSPRFPHRWRFAGSLAGAHHFQRLQLLPLFPRMITCPWRCRLPRPSAPAPSAPGALFRFAVRIDKHAVPRRARGQESLFANPLHACRLLSVPR